MIDPDSVFLGRPVHVRVDVLHDLGFGEVSYNRSYGALYTHVGEAWVGSARDTIVYRFLQSKCEWLVWIDEDVGFRQTDWDLLMEQQKDELAVVGVYPKKMQSGAPETAMYGLGFSRIHREVYERIEALKREDGSQMALRYRKQISVRREGDLQTAGAQQMVEMVHYHPQGVSFDGSWRGEDHGFWMLAMVAKIPIRMETRARLSHSGNFTWWQEPGVVHGPPTNFSSTPPEQDGGMLEEEDADVI